MQAQIVLVVLAKHKSGDQGDPIVEVYLPSDHSKRLAIICRTWNFLGSVLSRARKWMK